MRLSVRPGGSVVVVAPHFESVQTIEKFIVDHAAWIERAMHRMRHVKALPGYGKRDYRNAREAARELVHKRLRFFNSFYHFNYNRIAIKNTKTLWGSCSQKGNLNFSYALVHVPRELADYVIVHELCHLREHNHSARFWELVAKTQPDYPRLRRALRTYALHK